jgi:hypothetical protein
MRSGLCDDLKETLRDFSFSKAVEIGQGDQIDRAAQQQQQP